MQAESWVPALVSGGISLFSAAFVYGSLTKQTNVNTADIVDIKKEQRQQWKEIGDNGERISSVEGELKVRSAGAGR